MMEILHRRMYSANKQLKQPSRVVASILACGVTLGIFLVLPLLDLLPSKSRTTYTVRTVDRVVIKPPAQPIPEQPMREKRLDQDPKPRVARKRQLVSAPKMKLEMRLDALQNAAGAALQFGSDAFEFDLGPTGPLELSELDRLPQAVVTMKPMYPLRARTRNMEGYVQVQFTVSKDGRVQDAIVIEADPQGYFEKAALAAVNNWQFVPGEKNGEQVAVRVRKKLTFELRN